MSSGVAWIDRKVSELPAARQFLAGLGMGPRPAGGDRHKDPPMPGGRNNYPVSEGWRLPGSRDVLSDDDLIAFARSRGFRHGS